jgi:hypothetical protein
MSKPEPLDMLALVKALSDNIKDMKEAMDAFRNENITAANGAEIMFKTLNSKFDMFKNLESEARQAMKPVAPVRSLSRPQFFKKIFLDDEERETYMNILYTQEDIDEASNHDDVKSKKKDVDRITKIAAILYAALETKNRRATFENIFAQAKNQ